ncbi:TolC family protein [Fibrobacter sp. UWP2]|uniref:TolC family protein n=1 Tax=Fibrobacter sp. UWP2 TaxID=1896216 RepID=UPI000912E08F|nr:TolC family protein [Fibrobacter sp. UWP2]SHI73048.1 Outer membrane protein TolC [Fibrobacter sp. UWP2]
MKKSLLYIALGSALAQAASLSLQDALEMAKAGNSQIKAEKAKVEMAESGQSEARSRFMPTVTLSAGITRIDDPIYIDLTEVQTAMSGLASGLGSAAGAAAYSKAYIDTYNQAYQQVYAQATGAGLDAATATGMAESKAKEMAQENADTYAKDATQKMAGAQAQIDNADFKKKVQDDWFFNARLSVVWPIFTGLKIYSAYDAAKENVNARKAEFDMAQNSILLDVATKYFTLRLAEELSVMRETTKKNLAEHLERSKKLEAGGQISKAERLRAEVALAEAENAYEDALRDQSLARMALASLLHTDTSLTATTPVEAPENVRSMEDFKEIAKEKHPGLRQLRTERKRSQAAIGAARADYFPTIALFGYKELYTKDLTILEPEWAIGAKAQWDLFKGGETRSKVSNAKALDRSLSSMEEQTLDNIDLLVEKRWRELEHAKGRLASLVKTRELADEALRSQTRAYEAGLATGLDVVDAELALSRLQVADLKAHFDAVIAWLGLLEAAGEVADAGTMLAAKQRPVEKPAEVVPEQIPAQAPAETPIQTPAAAPAEPAANPVAAPEGTPAAEPAANPVAAPEGTPAAEPAPKEIKGE